MCHMGDRSRLLLVTAAMIVGYLVLARLALLTTGPNEVTLMWPGNGIIFAALLYFGPRWWPLPMIAVLLLHLTIAPVPLSFIPWSIASNVIGALAGVRFVRHVLPDLMNRFDITSGATLLGGGVVFALVSACFGAIGMWLSGQTEAASLLADGLRWAIGDLYGIIALTPAVLLGLPRVFNPGRVVQSLGKRGASRREQHIWLGLLVLIVLVSAWSGQRETSYALAMVGLPLAALIWGAVRLSPFPVAIANGVIAMLLVVAVNLGFAGPLPESTLDASLLIAFLCVIAAIPMTLSAGIQQSRQATDRMLQRANTDALTGLLNRSAFEYQARRRLGQSDGRPMALAYIDLDRFRLVNDATNHAVGDRLIRVVGGILHANLPTADLLARIGGDEFAVLMHDTSHEAALARAGKLCEAVAECRFQAGDHVATPTISVGLVSATAAGDREFGNLLALADTACFAAKEHGGNRVQRAQAGAQDAVRRSSDTMRWALRLGNALERDHFSLFCQPITPLHSDTRGLRHFEVLLRLREPGNPMVLPGQFMDAAERYALSVRLDHHVLDKILRWFERHPDRARQVELCSINLSAGSLQDEHFLPELAARIASNPLRPGQLCFELTETSALRDLGRAQQFIRTVRGLGCRFALDDFGTGFCSFGYLRSLDVDFFKIDGSFVRDIETSPLSYAIVRSIADIGRVMRKQTIAECVESDVVCQRLRDLGVDFAQGFAMGYPVEINEFFGVRGSFTAPG